MHADHDVERLPRSVALQSMTVDMLRDLLANAGDSRALGELVTKGMRELTGARSAILLQCLEDFGGRGHQVASLDPARRRALRESERRYRTVFDSAVEGIVVADVETTEIRYANSAVCRMLA